MKSFKSILALGLTLVAQAALAATPVTTTHTADGKNILADRNGATIYTFDHDSNNVSKCSAGCVREWPPVTLQAGESAEAPFGAIVRQDGTQQLTLNGRPLYLFVDDKKPGDTEGDGDGGVWHIVVVP